MSHSHRDEVRTVVVEFLRPGPPHNQLLSPLTRYLAVCGDSRVGEVCVPYEHSEFIRRLRDLRYLAAVDPEATLDPEKTRAFVEQANEGNRDRQAALIELSRQMSQMLSSVPGLSAQLSPRHCGSELVHIEIVITAAELAMLPFELAGTLEQPGSDPGGYLQLGAKPLISMTRRSRGVKDDCIKWPTQPKILFIAADPVQGVPYAQHIDALLRALQPWLPPTTLPSRDVEERNKAYTKSLREHLVVMKQASISEIAAKCEQESFSHIHVLAHGANDPTSPGKHFGIALHSDHDKSRMHVVSGGQFASALRRDGGELGPTVVTLASCDSGNVHDIMYTGASFAHELHRSGIPVVVASQFPLSVAGSAIMTEHLYRHLLIGRDPRAVLSDVRVRLHSIYGGVAHDWASLVTYAALPRNLEEQLEEARYQRARSAMDVALGCLDIEAAKMNSDSSSSLSQAALDDIEEKLFKRVDEAVQLLPSSGKYAVEGLGLSAAAQKRRAQYCFDASTTAGNPPKQSIIQRLQRSMDLYDKAFREGAKSPVRPTHTGPLHWSLMQQLSLSAVLEGDYSNERWATASELAKADLHGAGEIWAHTTLLELAVLRWWLRKEDQSAVIDHHTQELLELTREDTFPLHSTGRQLRRYTEWWWTKPFQALLKNAVLPSEEPVKKVKQTAAALQEAHQRRSSR